MFDPLSLVAPYDECEVLNKLQAYNTSKGADEMLDLMREIQYSGNYYWQGLAFPSSNYFPVSGNVGNGIGPNITINGSGVIPPGTIITNVLRYSSQPEGFKFKLYDKGSKASIFYGDYGYDKNTCGEMNPSGIYATTPSDPGSNADIPFGPNYVMSPLIITGPGVIGWEVVNLSPLTNVIQVLLSCAVPIGNRSIGNVVVNKGRGY